jgi:hypothetical protein
MMPIVWQIARQVTDDDIIQHHREQVANKLLGENSKCEETLMKKAGIQLDAYRPEDFETIDLKYFTKPSPKLLRAFIKVRELQDLSAAASLDPMPNKGTSKDAKEDVR